MLATPCGLFVELTCSLFLEAQKENNLATGCLNFSHVPLIAIIDVFYFSLHVNDIFGSAWRVHLVDACWWKVPLWRHATSLVVQRLAAMAPAQRAELQAFRVQVRRAAPSTSTLS
jgi:hypothetical protein